MSELDDISKACEDLLDMMEGMTRFEKKGILQHYFGGIITDE